MITPYLNSSTFLPLILPQIGLVEQEWLATLATINAEEVTFTDYVNKGRELATSLKNEVS